MVINRVGAARRLVLVVLLGGLPVAGVAEESSPVGRHVADFTLRDWRGKSFSLHDVEAPVVVLAVLGTECPLARLYGPRIQKIADRYAERGVAVLGINANAHDSITEIGAFARRHGIRFPLLKDVGNRVVDRLGAQRTPEVFVLDRRRIIRYCGRVDDQYGIGYAREAPRQSFLSAAIEDLLAGRAVRRPQTETTGCHIGRVKRPDATSPVTYVKDIAPILQRRCVGCHRDGDIAPFALVEYEEVAGWAEMIGEVVRQNRMPPWHAAPGIAEYRNDRRLTREEKDRIARWVAAGAPRGEGPAPTPAPARDEHRWQLPRRPDVVFTIQPEPFEVPAEGAVKYQYFVVPTNFPEERWIRAIDVQPGNRLVVHHILVFTSEASGRAEALRGGVDGFLAGYVPGLRSEPYPKGMAKRLPPHSKLVFQVHYTPVGTRQLDQSRIGIVFADPDEVKYELQTISAAQLRLSIPPGASDHRVDAVPRTIPVDAFLWSMNPHMHLRGKSFRYEVEFPDGRRQCVLDVPQYDFNWQTEYWLA